MRLFLHPNLFSHPRAAESWSRACQLWATFISFDKRIAPLFVQPSWALLHLGTNMSHDRAFDECFTALPCQSPEDGPKSDSTAMPQRDPLSRAGSRQGLAIRSSSSASVSQLPFSRVSRKPLPHHESTSSIPQTRSSGLAEFFEDREDENARYSDWDFQEISRHLRAEESDWSKVPRLYTVLRIIDELHTITKLLDQGYHDYWFPFDEHCVPRVLDHSSREKFLATQELVLTKAVNLEKGEMKEHAYFGTGDTFPFEVKEVLGRGGSAVVDKVCSTFSNREYARKRFKRGKGGNQEIETFKKEVQILKRLEHRHCIKLVSDRSSLQPCLVANGAQAFSYTDVKYISLIMSPVADCNLVDFYLRVPEDDRLLPVLRRFYGCLATALQYLHGSKIRHKDIKPENILVKGETVYLTDFGIALDFEYLTSGTTTEDTGKSWVYCAPEMTNDQSRNESSDIWSLGCVFVEMATVLKGRSIETLREYLKAKTGNYRFYKNQKGVEAWSRDLRTICSESEYVPLKWAKRMMQDKPKRRLTATDLCAEIAKETDTDTELFSCGCCTSSDDTDSTANSVVGSDAWAEDEYISPLTSRVGTDNSLEPNPAKSEPGSTDRHASMGTSDFNSPTIEVTAFQEEFSPSSNPLAGLEGPALASPPGRAKVIRLPSLFKSRSKETVTTTEDLQEGGADAAIPDLTGITINGEAEKDISRWDTVKQDYMGVASEMSAALQAVRSRRLSTSSDISAMVKPVVAWRPRKTSDAGLGVSGVHDIDHIQELQPLPALGPLSWTKPHHLVADVKNDSNFISFIESKYPNAADYVAGPDPKSIAVLVMLLLRHGLRVEDWRYVDNEGASPTFAVIEWGKEYQGVVMLMTRAGAKLQYETRDGSTPLSRAAARGHIWAIDILFEAGATLNPPESRRVPLVEAAMCGQLETVKHLLLILHAVPDQKTVKGKSPLYAAASKGHAHIVRYLLEQFRDQIDIEARFKGQPPLLDACLRNDVMVAQALLEHGADPNGGKDLKTGNLSYLHYAARAGHVDMVRLLIDHGADISARSVSLRTPLDEAKKERRAEVDFILRETKASHERVKRELQRSRNR